MSTIAPHQDATDTRRSLSTGGRFRRMLVGVLLALGMSVGTVATVAVPAQAASAVSACFTFANPPTHSAYANRPVFLYYKAPHGWEYLGRSGYTGSNGCATFYNTPTNVQLMVRAYINTQYQTWDGWSQYYANTGTGGANLGRGMVYRTR